MSKLRERAKEVYAEGVKERGNFTPSGTPLKVYNRWLENSRSNDAFLIRKGARTENFCHFWRVVAIWAPLLFLRDKAIAFVESRAGFAITLGLLTAAIVILSLTFQSIAIAVGIFAAAVYLLTGVAMGAFVGTGDYTEGERLLFVLFWLTIPVSVFSYLVGKGVKNFPKSAKTWFKSNAQKIFAGIFAVAALVYVVAFEFIIGWYFILVLAGALLAIGAVVFGLSFLADYLKGRRTIAATNRSHAVNETEESSEPVEPSAGKKFFSGLADFLILAFQVIRVKKWKICPVVEINSGESRESVKA